MLFSSSQKPFYLLSEFPEMQSIQQHYHVIGKELKNNKMWLNWGSDEYDPLGHCQFLKGDWTICPVYFGNYPPEEMNLKSTGLSQGEVKEFLAAIALRFPKTQTLIAQCKSVNFAAFSRLAPKSSLDPHQHSNPFSLIFHLGLVIPSGNLCGLKVDRQTHLWTKPGDAVIFDDNLEHSAWNHSQDKERVILYVDFLRHPQ